MTVTDTLVQPSEYRAEGAPPEWVMFPNLRLLFGWGDGLWETLGKEGMGGIRTAFILSPSGLGPPGLLEFIRWIGDYDANRPPMPFYARVLTGIGCDLIAANAICEGGFAEGQGEEATHHLEADPDYRVRHGVSDGRYPYLALERRTKKLKPEFQEMLRQSGAGYARGVGERGKQPDGSRKQRNPIEQSYVERVEAMKADYRDRRVQELLADPSKRPPRFLVLAALQERRRHEEIMRGKNGQDGLPHVPYTSDELALHAAHAVASTEATEMMFDYAWTRVCAFAEDGFTSDMP